MAAKVNLSDREYQDYKFIRLVLNGTITDSPRFTEWTNLKRDKHILANLIGFSRLVTFNFSISENIKVLLEKENYWVNNNPSASFCEVAVLY